MGSMVAAGGSACSSSNGSGGPTDAGEDLAVIITDAGHQDRTEVEASGNEEAGEDAGIDADCVPVPVDASFAFVPPNPVRNACTTSQIQTLYDDCWSSTSSTTLCDAFYGDPSNSPCILCMFSKSSATSWGPIVQFPNDLGYPNVGGCIELLTGDAGGCPQLIESYQLCIEDTCYVGCPSANTSAGAAAVQSCQQESRTTTCASETQAEQPCNTGTQYSQCVFADFQSYFLGVGAFFCAAGADGGVDAGGG